MEEAVVEAEAIPTPPATVSAPVVEEVEEVVSVIEIGNAEVISVLATVRRVFVPLVWKRIEPAVPEPESVPVRRVRSPELELLVPPVPPFPVIKEIAAPAPGAAPAELPPPLPPVIVI